MSIRTAENATVLYDSVTGLVLETHIFEDAREAAAFLRWATSKMPKWKSRPFDLREATQLEMSMLASDWMTLLADHTEDKCPFDGDDVDEPGWTNATDHSMGDGGTLAYPTRCTCECHEKGNKA